MRILVEPYLRTRFLVFVVHPRLRSFASIAFLLFFVVAIARAAISGQGVLGVVQQGAWLFCCAFLLFPLWNRYLVYPWAKSRPRKDRIGFIAFFEVFPLGFALWAMFAGAMWAA